MVTTTTSPTVIDTKTADLTGAINDFGDTLVTRLVTDETDIDNALFESDKGVADGVVPLDANAKIDPIYLPSFVDDVLEFATLSVFPATGESGKIYVDTTTKKIYRWGGTVYAEISAAPGSTDSVTEGATNKYFTEARVRSTSLTSISFLSSLAITATDTVLSAFGKLQKQISDAFTSLSNKANSDGSNTTSATPWPINITGTAAGSSTAGSADSSGKATNLAGGVAGAIPWQSGVDTTGFSSPGTAGQLFQSNGTQQPTWKNVNALSIGASQITGTLPILHGGTGATTADAALTALGAYPANNPSNFISAGGAPVQSVGGKVGVVTMVDLSLDKVDNTADVDKPVSTLTQNALNNKEDTANKNKTGGYPGLSGFKIILKNAAGTIQSLLASNSTVARTYTFPDKDITVAGLSDITGTNSGTNTGDETAATIRTKLGITTLSGSNTGDQTLTSLGIPNVENKSSATIRSELTATDVTSALAYTPVDSSKVGAASGVAPLGADSKIPSTYLPSYVDDVLEFATTAAFPTTGETGKMYVALNTNQVYRWGGTTYTTIYGSPGSSDAVPEGSVNLYFTAARVRATVITGLSTATKAAIAVTDTILVALGKLQAQISGLTGADISAPRATAATDIETAKELRWKKYGDGHTIFDASAGTAPNGVAVNNTNPGVNWGATYPTLMGWNGTSTYGVRVDVARYAESVPAVLGRVKTNGVSYGDYASVSVTGTTNSWAGIVFDDVSGAFMDNGTIHGYYRTNNKWLWQCDNSGNFTSTGNMGGYSDETLKTNWRDLDDDFLDKLADVLCGIYDRKDIDLTQAGVGAQSLQKILKEVVTPDKHGVLTVAYGNAALVAAVKLAGAHRKMKAENARMLEIMTSFEERLSLLEASGTKLR